MTRDEARKVWLDSGLNYSHLTLGRLQKLRDMLNAEMKASGLMATIGRSGGTFRANARIFAGLSTGGWYAGITCRSAHFKKREAVTFSDNGFIGFTGWADDVNIQPVLKAFVAWVAWMKCQVPAITLELTDVEYCLSVAEMQVQAKRCACRGSDDYCPCQNVPDAETRRQRRERLEHADV